MDKTVMTRSELRNWLAETDTDRLCQLFQRADHIRKTHVGDEVHFRGLIEFSNYCRRSCGYCGIRAPNKDLPRYRMTGNSILRCARHAYSIGLGSIVLQSGEDPGLDVSELCTIIQEIKTRTNLAVTLSLGERSFDDLAQLKIAGADRYLLRFETSNSALYERIHPPVKGQTHANRFDILRQLAELGYEVGSGIMVGIPGSTWDDLVNDLELFTSLDIDMIGIGPFIPHPGTPLGKVNALKSRAFDQPPNTPETVLKVLALTRILCPDVNIPGTTALETVAPSHGYENGLSCGANVIMPNITPMKYRRMYEIYPGKARRRRKPEDLLDRIRSYLETMGRVAGTGPGMSPHYTHRFFER